MGGPLIILGIILLVAGIVVNLVPGMKIPLLPGDIFIQKENVNFYFPIVSSIIISVILTLILNMFR